jgi:hypothetical protein
MIRYGNPQEVEEYFADGSVSQSYLKLLIKGVDYLERDEKKLYYEEKGHFVIGSAVDVWLTQGKENYDLQFFSFEGKKPSDTIMSIVQQVFDSACFDDNAPEGDIHQYVAYTLEAIMVHAYQPNWKEETRVNKIMEGGFEYFEQLKLAYGKQILSSIETTLVQNIVMSLETGKYTNKYFKSASHIDIYHQVPIYFTFGGVLCKALLDKVFIDRETQIIFPIDIKTMGANTVEFPYAVKSRGYNIQASFYTEALYALRVGQATCPVDMNINENYSVADFIFLVETTVHKTNAITGETRYNTGKPISFILSPNQLNLGKFGRPALLVTGITPKYALKSQELIHHKPIKGFIDALALYVWHQENGFEYDKETVESDGLILIE